MAQLMKIHFGDENDVHARSTAIANVFFNSIEGVLNTNLNQTGHTHQNATRTVNNICFVEQILPCYKC
jgi:hypothetical protein